MYNEITDMVQPMLGQCVFATPNGYRLTKLSKKVIQNELCEVTFFIHAVKNQLQREGGVSDDGHNPGKKCYPGFRCTTHNRADQSPGGVNCASDSAAGNFSYRMLRACFRADVPPPETLVDLISCLLGQDRPPAHIPSPKRRLATEYISEHPEAGIHKIAKAVGVSSSTIHGWIKDGFISPPKGRSGE